MRKKTDLASGRYLRGLSAAAFVALMFLSQHGVDEASAEPYDLTLEEVGADAKTSRILEFADTKVMLTGIPKLNVATKVVSYMAVSPINPIAATPSKSAESFFKGIANRPMTWNEASSACSEYTVGGKTWTLPSVFELNQINFYAGFASMVLDSKSEEGKPIRQNWDLLDGRFLPQFKFFWSRDGSPKNEAGLKMAAFFGKDGKKQSLSESRYLSVICVTYFSGPTRDEDRLVMPGATPPGKLGKPGKPAKG